MNQEHTKDAQQGNYLFNLIENVFAPKTGEKIILLNDFPADRSQVNSDYLTRRGMARAWKEAFSQMAEAKQFFTEELITYEPTGKNGNPLPKSAVQSGREISLEEKLDSLGEKDIVVAITKYSATAPLFSRLKVQKFRSASMPGALAEMSALKADYKIVARKALKLAGLLTQAEGAEVTFSTGHKCYFDLRGREASADDGNCREPGKGINLPSGEAYIAPYEGFDQKIGTSKTEGLIPFVEEGKLLVYILANNRIVNVAGNSDEAERKRQFFFEDPARGNIAELGLGCNDKAEYINCVLQDEKIEGMHWAYGLNAHFKGGQVGVSSFRKPEHALHIDMVYGEKLPLGINEIRLDYAGGKSEVVMRDNLYVVKFE